MLIREPYSDVPPVGLHDLLLALIGHADVDDDDLGFSSPDGGVQGFIARVVGVGGAEDHVLWPQLRVLHHPNYGGGRVGDEHEVICQNIHRYLPFH